MAVGQKQEKIKVRDYETDLQLTGKNYERVCALT